MATLLNKESAAELDNCFATVINVITDATQNFCKWKKAHPDADTTAIEQKIAQTVWTLLKTAETLSSTGQGLKIELEAQHENA